MEQLANEIMEYIAQQEQPVSVAEIAGHLSAKQDRRAINQVLIALFHNGDLERSLKDGKAYYTAPEARAAQKWAEFEKELTKLEQMVRDMEIDLHPSNIGDTGFDLYRWTFTEGTRKAGDGWSVAIPDGFSVISSEKRAFEAVPQGKETAEDDERMVRILPGVEQKFDAIQGKRWSYHLQARKGRVEAYGASLAQIQQKLMGAMMDTPLDCLSVVTEDVNAVVLVQDTSGGSFNYQIQMLTEGKSQALRVQTGSMTDEQKENMTQSVIDWVKTFRFDKPNPAIPKKAPLSNPQIPMQLRNGSTALFDQEADLAVGEAKFGLAGQIALQKYRVEQGILEETGAEEVQKAVDNGMEIVAYYVQAADALVAKLKQGKLPAKTMHHVYTKLQELNMEMNGLSVNGTTINGSAPEAVKGVCAKWEQAMNELPKAETPKPARSNVQAMQPPAKPAKNSGITSDSAVQDYVSRSERKLQNFRHEWEVFTEDVPGTLRELVAQGIRPSFSSRNTGNQIGVSLTFERDTSEAESYIETLRDRIDEAMAQIRDEIMDMDRDMERFQRSGLDSSQLSKLVRNLNSWIDYIPEMSFPLTDERMLRVTVADDLAEIRDKWRRISRNAPQKSTVDTPRAASQSPSVKHPSTSRDSQTDEAIKQRVLQMAQKREEEYRKEQEAEANARLADYARQMEEYQTALSQYRKAEKKAREDQDAHFRRLCTNERNDQLKQIDRKYYGTCSQATAAMERQRQRMEQAKLVLSQLKFWNFREKSEQQKILAEAEQIIAKKEEDISRAKQARQSEQSGVEDRIKQKENQFRQQAQNAHPMPVKPVEPQKPVSSQESGSYPTFRMPSYSDTLSEATIQNRKLADTLLDRMECGVWYNSSELCELLKDKCPGCNSSKVSAVVRHLGENVEYDARESGRVYRLRRYGSRNTGSVCQPPKKPDTLYEENKRLAKILQQRMDYDTWYTVYDLEELIADECPACTTSRIVAIMRQVPEGSIEKDKVKGRTVYCLKM